MTFKQDLTCYFKDATAPFPLRTVNLSTKQYNKIILIFNYMVIQNASLNKK